MIKRVSVGGKDDIVEIDESKFGVRKYKHDHKIDGTWVLGTVEGTPGGKIFSAILKNRNEGSLLKIINLVVAKQSIIHTDGWKGCNNFKVNFKAPKIGVHTNAIKGNWSTIKHQLPIGCRTWKLIVSCLVRSMFCRSEKTNFPRKLFRMFLL